MNNILQKVDQLPSTPGPEVSLAQVRRAQRDAMIARELEHIKNIPNIDKQAYVEKVLKNAQDIITRNADALRTLKELRDNPNADQNEVKNLFDSNPELIKARAYLILGIGLTKHDASSPQGIFFSQFLDKDISTNNLIDSLSNKYKESETEKDPKIALNILHDSCVSVATAECEKIIKYIEQNKQNNSNEPKKADPDKPAQKEPLGVEEAKAFKDILGVEIDSDGTVTSISNKSRADKFNLKIGFQILTIAISEQKLNDVKSKSGDMNFFGRILSQIGADEVKCAIEYRDPQIVVSPGDDGDQRATVFSMVKRTDDKPGSSKGSNAPEGRAASLGTTVGYLGVKVKPRIDFWWGKVPGAEVTTITPGSPADRAGLKIGDVILTFNNHKVPKISNSPVHELDAKEFFDLVSPCQGQTVSMGVFRGGSKAPLSLSVNVGSRHKQTGFGIGYSKWTDWTGWFQREGINIDNVSKGSPAQKAGLKRGDVITFVEVSGKEILIKTPEQFEKLLKDFPNSTMRLKGWRGGEGSESIDVTLLPNAESTDIRNEYDGGNPFGYG
jgi:C-terminal processing protease CtpA/Prc